MQRTRLIVFFSFSSLVFVKKGLYRYSGRATVSYSQLVELLLWPFYVGMGRQLCFTPVTYLLWSPYGIGHRHTIIFSSCGFFLSSLIFLA